MKLFILRTRLSQIDPYVIKPFFDKDKAMEAAADWLSARRKQPTFTPEAQALLNENMDKVLDMKEVSFYNGASIELSETDLDMSGVIDVLEDAQFTLGKQMKVMTAMKSKMTIDGHELATSRILATEQAIHLTLQKLKGQS